MWKSVSEALKDQCSLFVTSLAPRSGLRNPDIEAAVVKATSHHDSHIDYYSTQRIFAWIRVSGDYIRPVLWAISNRMKRTRSWTVALKGLMLLHGVFTCKVPALQKIGELPFDLSNFKDRNPDMSRYEQFIRAYYNYLQKKSLFMLRKRNENQEKQKQSSMTQDLVWVEKLQDLLDVLLEVKPHRDMRTNVLVLKALDYIVIEIFDIYSRICNGIAATLLRIYTAEKMEAAMALSVLQKAAAQGEGLSRYIGFCREFGVIKAKECPEIHRIPEEDIRDLEQFINRVQDQPKTEQLIPKEEDKPNILLDEEKNSTSNLKTLFADEKRKNDACNEQTPDLITF